MRTCISETAEILFRDTVGEKEKDLNETPEVIAYIPRMNIAAELKTYVFFKSEMCTSHSFNIEWNGFLLYLCDAGNTLAQWIAVVVQLLSGKHFLRTESGIFLQGYHKYGNSTYFSFL